MPQSPYNAMYDGSIAQFYRSIFLGCVLIAISCATWRESQATGRTLGPDGPPLNYHIDNVSIHLTRQPRRAGFIQSVSLFGNGSATVEHSDKLVRFSYPAGDLLNLLNEFYKIRFFDLPAKYTTRYSVFLKDDGTVGMSALRMSDATSTRLCIDIGEYEKCVTFGRDGPLELESIAKRVFIDMERISKGK